MILPFPKHLREKRSANNIANTLYVPRNGRYVGEEEYRNKHRAVVNKDIKLKYLSRQAPDTFARCNIDKRFPRNRVGKPRLV